MEDQPLELRWTHPESTFNKHFPGLDQKGLEKQYTKEWLKYSRAQQKKLGSKYSKKIAWENFQNRRGILLAPDKKGQWFPGEPRFKVRFTSSGKLQTSTAVGQQVRKWRDEFLTKGTPGTPISLEETKGQFVDPLTGINKELHHTIGLSEADVAIDNTIRKLLSDDPNIRQKGANEYDSFKRTAHKRNIILGSKAERYIALPKESHIQPTFHKDLDIPTSVHGRHGPTGDAHLTMTSGASDFGPETKAYYDRLPREDFFDGKRIGRDFGVDTVWDEYFDWIEYTEEPRRKAALAAMTDPANVNLDLWGKGIDPSIDPWFTKTGRPRKATGQKLIDKLGRNLYRQMDTAASKLRHGSLFNISLPALTLGGVDKTLGITDLLLPSEETVSKVKKEGITQESATSYGKDLLSSGTTYGAIRGVVSTAAKIKPLVPYIGKGMSVLSSVPGVVAGSVLTINEVDNRLFDGMGKKVLDEIRPNLPFQEEGRKQFEKNKEESDLSEFAMPF